MLQELLTLLTHTIGNYTIKIYYKKSPTKQDTEGERNSEDNRKDNSEDDHSNSEDKRKNNSEGERKGNPEEESDSGHKNFVNLKPGETTV